MTWVLTIADATAHATLALAVVTAVLACATVVLAAITHRGNASARAADANRLAASYRPVVVPLQRSSLRLTFRGGEIPVGTGPHVEENPADRADLPRYSSAFLAVENVGSGPALNVRGTYRGPRGTGETGFPVEAIGAAGKGVVTFENWEGESLSYTGNDQSVSAVLAYEDIGGATHRTLITFDVGHNAYRATFKPPAAEAARFLSW